MKITMDELRRVVVEAVSGAVNEAKRKKKGKPVEKKGGEPPVRPAGYSRSEKHDFSQPEPGGGRLKRQGAANFGPYTAESKLRSVIRSLVAESLGRPRGKSQKR